MDDPNYCLWFLGVPCRPLDWWSSAASLAQAILSAAAIYFAALAATAPDKLAKQRKARSYVALLTIAEEVLSLCADEPSGVILHSRLKQVTGQFAEVNVENVPDYRLLKPMQDTHSALAVVLDLIERKSALPSPRDRAKTEGLIQEMSTAYRDLLRVRKGVVEALAKEIAPENAFTRLAKLVRRK
jgi:hypothetical protein